MFPQAHAYPRNCSAGETEACSGFCALGCARGFKQSADRTFLADAARDGARVLTCAQADKILVARVCDLEEANGRGSSDGGGGAANTALADSASGSANRSYGGANRSSSTGGGKFGCFGSAAGGQRVHISEGRLQRAYGVLVSAAHSTALYGGTSAGRRAAPPGSFSSSAGGKAAKAAASNASNGSKGQGAGQGAGEGAAPPPVKVLVRADYVFCAAGALHSAALLLRSGLSGGGNVGKHLRCALLWSTLL